MVGPSAKIKRPDAPATAQEAAPTKPGIGAAGVSERVETTGPITEASASADVAPADDAATTTTSIAVAVPADVVPPKEVVPMEAATSFDAAPPPTPAMLPPGEDYPPDAPNEREPIVPTLAECLAAGYTETYYHRRFGRNPTPNTATAKATAAEVASAPRVARTAGKMPYRVWALGALQHDGKLYEPGSVVELSAGQAEAIGASVSPVVE